MTAANELATDDGRYDEKRRRAAAFQLILDADAEHLADVIELHSHRLQEAS